MYGLDISNVQAKIDLTKGNFDFCICKLTEGKTLLDKSVGRFLETLTAVNKRIGLYHFCRPDINRTEELMRSEAYFYVDCLNKYDMVGRALLVCDWESNQAAIREDLLQVFMDTVYVETGVRPFIYANISMFRNINTFMKTHMPGRWAASWPSAYNGLTCGARLPGVGEVTTGESYEIWQYTSHGQFPEYNGRVDLDYTKMTPEEWDKACHPDMASEAGGIEKYSIDMQWAISHGLFLGHSDGTFRPDEPLTRSQSATVLRRFYHMINTEEFNTPE